MMAEQGFLVIADITGYTAFLSGTELEHAQDSLRSLLELLVNNTRDPLRISRLEGDAVISFALDDSFIQSQTLVENLETTYVAFRLAQQHMQLNTTCPCKACQNIPNLDLKFIIHYGEFMLQDIGPYKELIGPEVNLTHRLAKNSITESTEIKAYAAFTEAAIEALAIEGLSKHLIIHQQADEYLDQLPLYVQDLHMVWEENRDRHSILVEPEQALVVVEEEFPISPMLLWDYLTSPEYRAVLNQADHVDVQETKEGRINKGSIYVCVHGDYNIHQAIVDWHPFDYFTIQVDGGMPGTSNLLTTHLLPSASGTKVLAAIGHSSGPEQIRQQWDEMTLQQAPELIREGCVKLQERIQDDLAKGVIVQPGASSISHELIEAAVTTALTDPAA
jgi:hypothetical protein